MCKQIKRSGQYKLHNEENHNPAFSNTTVEMWFCANDAQLEEMYMVECYTALIKSLYCPLFSHKFRLLLCLISKFSVVTSANSTLLIFYWFCHIGLCNHFDSQFICTGHQRHNQGLCHYYFTGVKHCAPLIIINEVFVMKTCKYRSRHEHKTIQQAN